MIESEVLKDFKKLSLMIKERDEKIKSLESRLANCIELPVKIGNKVYKICPKCNDNHNGTCKNCAWGGCLGACDVGVHIYSDGSYTEKPLQIVEKLVTDHNIITVYDWWNIMFFDDEVKAKQAMKEYDSIRTLEDRTERVEKFRDWYNGRKIKNPLKMEEKGNE